MELLPHSMNVPPTIDYSVFEMKYFDMYTGLNYITGNKSVAIYLV